MSVSTVATNTGFSPLFDASIKCTTMQLCKVEDLWIYAAVRLNIPKFGCNYLCRVIDFT